MNSHPKWGNKFTCYSCDCKFYDLGNKTAICPKCGADQSERSSPVALVEEVEEPVEEETTEVVEDGEDAAIGIDDDLPEMEEELGYDETDDDED